MAVRAANNEQRIRAMEHTKSSYILYVGRACCKGVYMGRIGAGSWQKACPSCFLAQLKMIGSNLAIVSMNCKFLVTGL